MPATPQALLVGGARTPVGRYGGALASVRPDDLAALVVRHAVTDAGIDPHDVDEVILGNANGAGEENRNVARMAVLLAGLPLSVLGATVNRLCGSGLDALNRAAGDLALGHGEVAVAGGVEGVTGRIDRHPAAIAAVMYAAPTLRGLLTRLEQDRRMLTSHARGLEARLGEPARGAWGDFTLREVLSEVVIAAPAECAHALELLLGRWNEEEQRAMAEALRQGEV